MLRVLIVYPFMYSITINFGDTKLKSMKIQRRINIKSTKTGHRGFCSITLIPLIRG